VLIECFHCDSRVDATEKGEVAIHDAEDHGWPTKYVLVECPVCRSALLGISELIQTGEDRFEWDGAGRVWPAPETNIDWNIPEIARVSLIEAKVCFKARAYAACAVMCGRTLEGVCKHHDAKTRGLAAGLKKLKDAGVIDTRLYEWGEALRSHRNLGAHATVTPVSREDARDLLDFSIAICEYIFVLNEKFARFRARQNRP
jgi:hypothetical protein